MDSVHEQEWYENDAIRYGYGDGWFTTLLKGKKSVHLTENIVCISNYTTLDGEKMTSIAYGDIYFLADTPDAETIWNLFMVASGKYDESRLNIPTEGELAERRELERQEKLRDEVDKIAQKLYEEEIRRLAPVTNRDRDYIFDTIVERLVEIKEKGDLMRGRYLGFTDGIGGL